MSTITEARGGQASSLSLLLILAFRFLMGVLNAPMGFVQRRFGIAGMGAVFLAPNMLIFGVFVLIPVAINIAYSLTGGTAIFFDDRHFVGLDQYQTLLTCSDYTTPSTCLQDSFWQSVHNTALFVLLQVSALVLVSLGTALVLNREMRARGFWRGVFFFPVLLSQVVGGLIWKWILQRDGLLNAILLDFGFERTLWLAERNWAMFWAIFVSVWAHMGFSTLILLAGLQAIPSDIYEAAEMDATPRWRVFWRLTLPLLWPNLIVVIVLSLIRAVQTFDEVCVLTGGGPGTSTLMVVQYIYETAFSNQVQNFGLAAAASVVLGIVLFALTLAQLAFTQRKSS